MKLLSQLFMRLYGCKWVLKSFQVTMRQSSLKFFYIYGLYGKQMKTIEERERERESTIKVLKFQTTDMYKLMQTKPLLKIDTAWSAVDKTLWL